MNKKMKKKTWLPVMLILALSLVLIAGCNKSSSDTTASQAPAASSNNAVVTDAPAPTAAVANGNITVLYYSAQADYEKSKAANPNAYDAVFESIPEFEKMYGGKVTVKTVEYGKQRDNLIAMTNAGDVADVAPASDQFFPIYPLKKLVQPIDQYIDMNDPMWNKAVTQTFSFGGKPYAVGATSVPVLIYYNKTIFEKNGVKSPADYYKEGNWTWDTFRDVAKQLTMDTDGDGKIDQYGFNWWDGGYSLWVTSNGKPLISYNNDGTIVSNLDTDNIKQALQFTQDAYLKDKFINIAEDGDKWIASFKNGKLAMAADYGFGGFTTFKSSYAIDYVPIPKGPMGEADTAQGGLGGWAIPTIAKNPQGAAAFIKMVAANDLKSGNAANVKAYGQDKADAMNHLAAKSIDTPVGIEKYWDANTLIITSLKKGTPVGTIVQQAKAITDAGIKITLTQ